MIVSERDRSIIATLERHEIEGLVTGPVGSSEGPGWMQDCHGEPDSLVTE